MRSLINGKRSLLRWLLVSTIILLTMSFSAVTVSAQTQPVNADGWRFVTVGDKLYIASGSKEFVTEVDTSQLKYKSYIRPQSDQAGNLYLMSPASKGSGQATDLSVFYTQTDGKNTVWKELTAKDIGLGQTSGIYDFVVTAEGNLTIIGAKGEVLTGKAGVDNSFKSLGASLPERTSFTKPVSTVGKNLIPTTSGPLVLVSPNGSLAKASLLEGAIGDYESIPSLGPALYLYAGPRHPQATDRKNLAYVHDFSPESLTSIELDSPVVDVLIVGDFDHFLILTEQKVWMMSKPIGKAFSTLVDVTAKLGASKPISAITGYNKGKDNVFYGVVGNEVIRLNITSPTDITVSPLKLLAPTYKIGSPVTAVGSGGAFAPTPVDPNEVVPNRPQVPQAGNQPQSVNTESVPASTSSNWTPVVVGSIVLIIMMLVVVFFILRRVFRKAQNRIPDQLQPINPGTPGPSSSTSISGSGDRGHNPFRPR